MVTKLHGERIKFLMFVGFADICNMHNSTLYKQMQKHTVGLFSKKKWHGQSIRNCGESQYCAKNHYNSALRNISIRINKCEARHILGIKQRSQKKTLKNDELHLPIQIGHLCP